MRQKLREFGAAFSMFGELELRPQRGGILRCGDTLGWPKVMEKLKKYEPLGKRFQATETIKQLAASGKKIFPG